MNEPFPNYVIKLKHDDAEYPEPQERIKLKIVLRPRPRVELVKAKTTRSTRKRVEGLQRAVEATVEHGAYPMVPNFLVIPSQSRMSLMSLRVILSFQNLAFCCVQIPTPPALSLPMSTRRKGQAVQRRNLLASADLPFAIRYLVQLM